MRMRIALVILILVAALFMGSCGKETFSGVLEGSAGLKDHSVMTYSLTVEFNDVKGRDEFNEKKEKIGHALRLILMQRNRDQIDSRMRLMSVVNKVFGSLMSEPVKRVTVESIRVEP
ncbi:hypothetical protein JCM14469_09850 [Desulfatiferula olefinivorans]